jgi:integrase/recombinase XerD
VNGIHIHRYGEKLELLGYAKRTIGDYCFALRWFLQYLEEQESVTDIQAITPAHLTAYHTHLQYGKFRNGRYLTNGTIRDRLNAIKLFLRIFHEEGILPEDLTHHITPPKAKRPLPKNIPSAKDMVRLLEAVRPVDTITLRDRTMLELMYATGIRALELLTLSVDSINLSDKTLFVHGKGSKDRVVPLGAWLMPWLIEYLESGRPKLLPPGKSTDILFISKRGLPLAESNLCWILRKYLARTALTSRLTPHSFRHACATHMLQGGADIRYIQELLGHVDVSTTQIYTKVDISELKTIHGKYHPREKRDDED